MIYIYISTVQLRATHQTMPSQRYNCSLANSSPALQRLTITDRCPATPKLWPVHSQLPSISWPSTWCHMIWNNPWPNSGTCPGSAQRPAAVPSWWQLFLAKWPCPIWPHTYSLTQQQPKTLVYVSSETSTAALLEENPGEMYIFSCATE